MCALLTAILTINKTAPNQLNNVLFYQQCAENTTAAILEDYYNTVHNQRCGIHKVILGTKHLIYLRRRCPGLRGCGSILREVAGYRLFKMLWILCLLVFVSVT